MYYRSYKYFNDPQFLYDLSCSGLNDSLHFEDRECLDIFYEKFLKTFDMHAPKNKKRVKGFQQQQWYNEEIILYKNKETNITKRRTGAITKSLETKHVHLSKQKYFNDAINQNKDTGTIWKYIKDLNPKEISDFPMRLKLGDATEDKVPEIVETRNTQFCEIADNIKTENHTPDFNLLHDYIQEKLSNDDNKFKIESIQPESVMKYLNTLNINTGTGLDGLTQQILKLAEKIIYLPLSHIINMSFKYDTFLKIQNNHE